VSGGVNSGVEVGVGSVDGEVAVCGGADLVARRQCNLPVAVTGMGVKRDNVGF
jgi:hypothetical protein